jgi:hypothetical protein
VDWTLDEVCGRFSKREEWCRSMPACPLSASPSTSPLLLPPLLTLPHSRDLSRSLGADEDDVAAACGGSGSHQGGGRSGAVRTKSGYWIDDVLLQTNHC